jgi:hypothetical protein
MAKKAKKEKQDFHSGAGNIDISISPKSDQPAPTFSDSGAGETSFTRSHNLDTSSVILPEILPYGFLKAKLVLEADQVTYQTRDGMVVLAAATPEEMIKKLNDLMLL